MLIENFDGLATTALRKQALLIADSGLQTTGVREVETPLNAVAGELVFVQGDNTVIKALLAAGATTAEIHTVIGHLPNLSNFGQLSLIVNETKTIPESTMHDAAQLLQKYKVLDTAALLSAELVTASAESHHIQIISLDKIVTAMKQKAEDLSWPVSIWGKINSAQGDSLGESIVKKAKAGYCTIGFIEQAQSQAMTLETLPLIGKNQVLLAMNSEGFGNDAAGAIVDQQTFANAEKLYLDPAFYLANRDSYHFLEQLNALIFTNQAVQFANFFVCLTKKS